MIYFNTSALVAAGSEIESVISSEATAIKTSVASEVNSFATVLNTDFSNLTSEITSFYTEISTIDSELVSVIDTPLSNALSIHSDLDVQVSTNTSNVSAIASALGPIKDKVDLVDTEASLISGIYTAGSMFTDTRYPGQATFDMSLNNSSWHIWKGSPPSITVSHASSTMQTVWSEVFHYPSNATYEVSLENIFVNFVAKFDSVVGSSNITAGIRLSTANSAASIETGSVISWGSWYHFGFGPFTALGSDIQYPGSGDSWVVELYIKIDGGDGGGAGDLGAVYVPINEDNTYAPIMGVSDSTFKSKKLSPAPITAIFTAKIV